MLASMFETLGIVAAAFFAATVSGIAGFGGALLLLPALVHWVGLEAAVPLLTMAQLIGNLARVGFGRHEIAWRPVGVFLLAAVPASLLGAQGFVTLPADLVIRAVGGALLVFAVLSASGRLTLRPGRGLLLVGGAVTGGLSGLVGSAGPLGAAVFLSLGLPPTAYVASEAATALVLHAAKMALYQSHFAFGAVFWTQAALLGVAMVTGTYVARRLVTQMPVRVFKAAVGSLLALIGLWMLWAGA